MKIAVVGLGLIGGSLCKTIVKRTNHRCYGMDIDPVSVQEALEYGAIEKEIAPEELREMDLTIVCLHPYQTIAFILEQKDRFCPGSMVIDVCGVKTAIVQAVTKPLQERGVTFIGTHPMAGREFSGFRYAEDDLFDRASFIITPTEETPADRLEDLELLARELHFNRIVYATTEEHDGVIAFTSQLAHVVSNAYVKSPSLLKESGFSAGSFLDLTRVAKLNASMWTELFLCNRDPLLFEINTILKKLEEYRDALEAEDPVRLCQILKEGSDLKEESLRKNSSYGFEGKRMGMSHSQ